MNGPSHPSRKGGFGFARAAVISYRRTSPSHRPLEAKPGDHFVHDVFSQARSSPSSNHRPAQISKLANVADGWTSAHAFLASIVGVVPKIVAK